MGEMAEYYSEDLPFGITKDVMDTQTDVSVNKVDQYHSNNLYWRTSNGRKLLIQDMSDHHLKNTIRYLVNHNGAVDIIYILSLEQYLRKNKKH